jgi:outer membrane protein assembly factor BamB
MTAFLAIVVTTAPLLAGDSTALGGKDFYPSSEQPVGYRGDGNGWFPGATPVATFGDGKAVKIDTPGKGWGKPKFRWSLGDAKSHNIVWKVATPSWVNSQPIVVGDKVFTCGEPDFLFCYDAKTGKLLWQRSVNPWLAAGLDPKKAETCRNLANILRALDAVICMQFHFNTCGRYLEPKEYDEFAETFLEKDLPVLLARLKQVDPETDYSSAAKATEKVFRSWMGKEKRIRSAHAHRAKQKLMDDRKATQLFEQVRDRLNALAGVRDLVPTLSPWGNMVGWNMASPVSDGKDVFVQMGQGQLACFDLQGNLKWAIYPRNPYTGTRTGSARANYNKISPLLVGDVFVTNLPDESKLMAFDKKTGKKVWESPVSTTRKSRGRGYNAADHMVMRIDGKPIIVTTKCLLIRPADGEVVGEYDAESYGGGPPIAGYGNLFIKAASGDGFAGPFYGYRLSYDGEKAVAKKIWETKTSLLKGGYNSRIVLPSGYAVVNGHSTGVLDVRDGSRAVGRGVFNRNDFCLMAGTTLLEFGGGSHLWSKRDEDGKALTIFRTFDMSSPKSPRSISDANILDGTGDPKDPTIQNLIPNLWAHGNFFNARGGKPAHSMNADTCMFPSGNRLFIRTVNYLYCIGDPKVEYDWNPASRSKNPGQGKP